MKSAFLYLELSKTKCICIYLLLLFIFNGFSLSGQDPFHKQYTTFDGLPSLEIYDLHEDSLGQIWLATDRGISVYDGTNFQNFTIADGLTSNTHFEIFESPDKTLLFSSFDGGLTVYKNGKFSPFELNAELKNRSFGRWIIGMVFKDESALIFLKGFLPNYFVIDLNEQKINEYHLGINDTIQTINWKGHAYKYSYINGFQNQFTKENSSFTIFNNGDLHINRENGIVDVKKDKFYDFIWNVEKENRIWLGTSKGLELYDYKTQEYITSYFTDSRVTSILKSYEHGYWVSTLNDGLLYVPTFDVRSLIKDDFENKNSKLKCFARYEDKAFFTTNNFDLYQVNKKDERYSYQKIKKEQAFDAYGSYNAKSFISLTFRKGFGSNNVNIVLTKDDFLAILGSGAKYYKWDSLSYNPPNILEGRITSIIWAKDSTLILGTFNGLSFLNKRESDNYKKIGTSKFSGRVSDLEMLSDTLIMSTLNHGLYVLKNKELVKIKDRGLPKSLLIHSVCIVGSDIIIASNMGAYQCRLRRDGPIPELEVINILTCEDGLLSNFVLEISYWDDHLWIIMDNGISYLPYPIKNKAAPLQRLIIENVKVGDSTIIEGTRLEASKNDITFKYKAIGQKKSSTLPLYNYRLNKNNRQTSWIDSDQGEVSYVDLGDGKYTFEVRSRNENNQFSSTQAFSFTINKPIHKTWWFRLLLGSCAIMVAYSILNIKWKSEKQKRIIKETLLQLKEAELDALHLQMNPHFIFNTLNSIQNFIFNNEKEIANKYLSLFSETIRHALEFSKQKVIKLSDEINFLKDYLEIEKMRFQDTFDYSLSIDPSIDIDQHVIPPLLLQPIVENSVKHGFKSINYKGQIEIEIKALENGLKITIEDNGNGILTKTNYTHHKRSSMGIKNVGSRLLLLDEHFSMETAFVHGEKPNDKGYKTIITLKAKHD